MFYHLFKVKSDTHIYRDNTYEISVYKAEEDGHLRGYISSGKFSELIIEMSNETASDARHYENDPIEMLVSFIKSEIDAGKFLPESNT